MLGHNQYLNYRKYLVQTRTLATKDPYHASAVPCNIKAAILSINAIARTTHPFEDDRRWTADNRT